MSDRRIGEFSKRGNVFRRGDATDIRTCVEMAAEEPAESGNIVLATELTCNTNIEFRKKISIPRFLISLPTNEGMNRLPVRGLRKLCRKQIGDLIYIIFRFVIVNLAFVLLHFLEEAKLKSFFL